MSSLEKFKTVNTNDYHYFVVYQVYLPQSENAL